MPSLNTLVNLVGNNYQPQSLTDVRANRDLARERVSLGNQQLALQNNAGEQALAQQPLLQNLRQRAIQGDQLAQIQLYSIRPQEFAQLQKTLSTMSAGQRAQEEQARRARVNQTMVALNGAKDPQQREALLKSLAVDATTEQLSKYYAQQETGRHNVAMENKPTASTTVVNNIGDKGFTELAKGMSKELLAQRQGAMDAAASLKTNEEAIKLLNSGSITGSGAQFLISAGKLLQRVGINAFDDPIANTEAFQAAMAQNVGRIIKLFGSGTGLSDADREYAQKAAAGQITLSEQSLRRIIGINDRASRAVIQRYNVLADRVSQRPEAQGLPYDLKIDEQPPSTVQQTGGIKFLGFE